MLIKREQGKNKYHSTCSDSLNRRHADIHNISQNKPCCQHHFGLIYNIPIVVVSTLIYDSYKDNHDNADKHFKLKIYTRKHPI